MHWLFVCALLCVALVVGNEEAAADLALSTSSSSAAASLSAAGAITCEAENQLLLQRLERLERIFNVSHMNPDLDDTSLLELFVLQARSKILSSVPATDPECSFNWLVGKCYPLCRCEFAPKLGDLSPTRACRLVPPARLSPSCDASSAQTPWMLRLAQGLSSAAQASHSAVRHIGSAIADNAPATDAHCRWSWRALACAPRQDCTLAFELGDYSLDRMCRLRFDFDDEMEKDEGENAEEEEEELKEVEYGGEEDGARDEMTKEKGWEGKSTEGEKEKEEEIGGREEPEIREIPTDIDVAEASDVSSEPQQHTDANAEVAPDVSNPENGATLASAGNSAGTAAAETSDPAAAAEAAPASGARAKASGAPVDPHSLRQARAERARARAKRAPINLNLPVL